MCWRNSIVMDAPPGSQVYLSGQLHHHNGSVSVDMAEFNLNAFPPLDVKPWNVVVGIFLSFFVVLTIGGNALVIYAVIRERYLRTITNYFIVSLATADLFMGTLVMPFAVILEVLNEHWPFGQVWCDLWHAFDVLSSTASILNLCMIALERFWATENPLTYTSRMTRKRCLQMCMLVWICSSAISFPAIIWWRIAPAKLDVRNITAVQLVKMHYTCHFTDDIVYLVSSSIVSFYGPLVVMIVVYYRIYQTANQLIRSLNAGTKIIYKNGQHGEYMVLRIHRGGVSESASIQNLVPGTASSCSSPMSKKATVITTDSDPDTAQAGQTSHLLPAPRPLAAFHHSSSSNLQLDSRNHDSSSPPGVGRRRSSQNPRVPSQEGNDSSPPADHRDDNGKDAHSLVDDPADPEGSANQSIARKIRHFAVGKRLSKFAREQKAAKTLGIVMGIFIICWLPFFVLNIVFAIQKTEMTDSTKRILAAVTWLGYINSSINPIIYAHSMRDFRRAFIKLLCSCYLRRRSSQNAAAQKNQLRVAAAALPYAVQTRKLGRVQHRPQALGMDEHTRSYMAPHPLNTL